MLVLVSPSLMVGLTNFKYIAHEKLTLMLRFFYNEIATFMQTFFYQESTLEKYNYD
jgi:hypothetical protein